LELAIKGPFMESQKVMRARREIKHVARSVSGIDSSSSLFVENIALTVRFLPVRVVTGIAPGCVVHGEASFNRVGIGFLPLKGRKTARFTNGGCRNPTIAVKLQ
jgi:hypothetical protein